MRFLELFEDNKPLGKNSLKFAKTFTISLSHDSVTEVGHKEDYFTVGQILREHGQEIRDFENPKAALAAVRHLCKKNAKDQGYNPKPEAIDTESP